MLYLFSTHIDVMNKQIHIVEDDEDIRFIIAYILKENGYKVEISGTIADFNLRIKQYIPDLILLDVMLPDGNGIDLCLELKTQSSLKHIPIIIMSAHATEKSVVDAACADEFIGKPFDLDDLLVLVKKHLPD